MVSDGFEWFQLIVNIGGIRLKPPSHAGNPGSNPGGITTNKSKGLGVKSKPFFYAFSSNTQHYTQHETSKWRVLSKKQKNRPSIMKIGFAESLPVLEKLPISAKGFPNRLRMNQKLYAY